MNHFFENDGLNVLTQEVEQEPVTALGFFHHYVNAFTSDPSVPSLEQECTDSSGNADKNTIGDH